MVLTYKQLGKIQFPVYLLDSDNWDKQDGLLYCDGMLVDDTNQEGKTLGIRRLQTTFRTQYPLKRSIASPNGILKQRKPYFIDTRGVAFSYQKTLMCSMKYFEITEVILKETASIIRVKGVRTPFTVPRPPDSSMSWAGILHLHGLPWMLYEYSETKLKDTKRKV